MQLSVQMILEPLQGKMHNKQSTIIFSSFEIYNVNSEASVCNFDFTHLSSFCPFSIIFCLYLLNLLPLLTT